MAAVTMGLPEGASRGWAIRRKLSPGNSPRGGVFRYSRGETLRGKEPQIAGLSRRELIRRSVRAQVDAIQINDEELKDEVERDLQARRERLSADLPDARRAP